MIKPLLINGVVLLLVSVSAIGVIYSSYQSRQLFAELQDKKREEMRLQEQWGRLLLERSTWASPARIERIAKSQLNMIEPEQQAVTVVQE